MDRIYRVIAIRRDGVWQYWEPTLGLFTYKEIPTNRYYKYTEALREYRRAIEGSNPDDMSCVSIHEKTGTDGTWYTLKERQFTQNERSAESIMIDIGTARLSMKTTSGKLREMQNCLNSQGKLGKRLSVSATSYIASLNSRGIYKIKY